ncbi:MAG: hypothetical protein K8E24_012750 [Methanobacterium paludis]|nr:hypothetical protein [Methanobacterium paludis]
MNQDELAESANMLGSALGRLKRSATSASLKTIGRNATAPHIEPWALSRLADEVQTGVRLETLEPPTQGIGD